MRADRPALRTKSILPVLLFLFLVLGLAVFRQSARAASAVVGTGTPSSCTEIAFDTALTTAGNGGGTITFDCGAAVHTLQFTVAKVVNLGDITIDGGGRIILAAGNNERHFFAGPVTFRLRNITLRQGDSLVNGGAIEASGGQVILESVRLLDNRSAVAGGAIYCYDATLAIDDSQIDGNSAPTGGAIFNDGCAVTIRNSSFADNRATAVVNGRGGAVDNAQPGRLTIRSSRFRANNALDGGALYNASGASADLAGTTFEDNTGGYGGAIENSGVVTITDSLLHRNSVTGSGGGLWNIGGSALLERSTVSANTAFEGGGVSTYGPSLEIRQVNLVGNTATAPGGGGTNGGGLHHLGGYVSITDATISGNAAQNNGGGIYQVADDNLTLTNVTLANNTADVLGGGLYHYGRYAVLTNVTLANNSAGAAGAAIYEDSPQTPANPGVVQLANSVVYGSAVNCDGGLFQSLGYNLSQGSCASLNASTDRDAFTGALLVGSLAYNGGSFPMQTVLPQSGSPLIDGADATQCNATDQRGAARVGTCDIGAVEYGAEAFDLYLPAIVR